MYIYIYIYIVCTLYINIYIFIIIYILSYIYIYINLYIYIIAHDDKLRDWVTYGLAMLPDPVLQWDGHPPYRRLMLNRCLKT